MTQTATPQRASHGGRVFVVAVLMGVGALTPAGAAPSAAVPGEVAARRGAPIAAKVLAHFRTQNVGRYIVVMEDRADLGGAVRGKGRSARRESAHALLRDQAARSQADVRDQLERAEAAGMVQSFRPFWLVNAVAVESNERLLRFLATRPGVKEIAADEEVRLVTDIDLPNAPATALLEPGWSLAKIGAPDAWEAGIDGSGVVVANVDTGVDYRHPALFSKYRGADGDHDYDWWSEDFDSMEPSDWQGHGTHTMGTMVGGDGFGPDPNDIGVAHGARWIAAQLSTPSTTFSRTLSALEWVTAPTRLDGSDPRPDLGPDVVNNSWGLANTCVSLLDDVLAAWRAFGIVGIWAAGNTGPQPSTVGAPADLPLAFAVGATDSTDTVYSRSGRGPSCYGEVKPDVTAPGVAIVSAHLNNSLRARTGTSMAAPHVAGAAALMLAGSGSQLSVGEVEALLEKTAIDLGDPGPDNSYGTGRLQAGAAALAAHRGVGALEVSVVDAEARPVGSASVSLEGPSGVSEFRTGEDGTYRRWVTPGDYALRAGAFGFLPAQAQATVVEAASTRVAIQLHLAPVVTVTGTVRAWPTGDPLPGASIRARATPTAPVIADEQGTYRLEVPTGSYTFDISPDNCHTATQKTVTIADHTALDWSARVRVDGFGYRCEVTPFVEEPGTARVPVTGDDTVAEVSLPFPVRFYSGRYERAFVHTNGYLSFTSATVERIPGSLPSDSDRGPNGAIYGLWTDLVIPDDPGAGVFVATYGSAPSRRFVVEYRGVRSNFTGERADFSIVVGEDETFEVRWARIGRSDAATAVSGVEDENGIQGLQYRGGDTTPNHSAVQFRPGPVAHVVGSVVRNGDRRPLPGAMVRVGTIRSRAGEGGAYRLALLPGTYTLVAFYPSPFERKTIQVSLDSVGQTVRADIALDGPGATVTTEPVTLDGTCDEVSAQAGTITSTGSRPVRYDAALNTPLRRLLEDPIGDSTGVDVTRVDSSSRVGHLDLAVTFAPSTRMDQLSADVMLDTDQHPATGIRLHRNAIGADFHILLDEWISFFPSVLVFAADGSYVGDAPASIVGHTVRLSLDLEWVEDDGNLNLAVVASGASSGSSDTAPDAYHAQVEGGDDWEWLSLAPSSATLAPGEVAHLMAAADPSRGPEGTFLLEAVIQTTDPFNKRPPPAAITVTVRPHLTTPSGRCLERR